MKFNFFEVFIAGNTSFTPTADGRVLVFQRGKAFGSVPQGFWRRYGSENHYFLQTPAKWRWLLCGFRITIILKFSFPYVLCWKMAPKAHNMRTVPNQDLETFQHSYIHCCYTIYYTFSSEETVSLSLDIKLQTWSRLRLRNSSPSITSGKCCSVQQMKRGNRKL